MIAQYETVADLEAVAIKAIDIIKVGRVQFNFCLSVAVPAKTIAEHALRDQTELAKKWQAAECPNDLHFNHGKYIGDGIQHIIKELKSKPSSNRALYSLLNQKDISESEDKPIPSFMIMQCGVDHNDLYCTVYFRALEVSNFLRINLEEIRLTLHEILKENHDVADIKLTIFSFKAYNNPQQTSLQRAKLDMMTGLGLADAYTDRPEHIAELLDDKAKETTVIDLTGFYAIKEWLAPGRAKKNSGILNQPKILKDIEAAITVGSELQELRKKHSYHKKISDLAEKYIEHIKSAAKEFRND